MNFTLAKFIKNGFISAVGKMADYQIILNAAGWYEKGVLTEDDLAEIQAAIDEKNARLEAEAKAKEEAEKELGSIDGEMETESYTLSGLLEE